MGRLIYETQYWHVEFAGFTCRKPVEFEGCTYVSPNLVNPQIILFYGSQTVLLVRKLFLAKQIFFACDG